MSQKEIILKFNCCYRMSTDPFLAICRTFLFLTIIMLGMLGCKRGSEERHNDSKIVTNDFGQGIPGILYRAKVQLDSFGFVNKADSLLELAINEAVKAGKNDQIAMAYTFALKYSSSKPVNEAQALEFYNTGKYHAGLSGSISLLNELNFAMAHYYTKRGNTGQSEKYLNQISFFGGSNFELYLKKEMAEAANFGVRDKPFEQLKSLLDAMYKAYELGHDSIYQACLLNISDFYYYEQQYNKALDYIDQLQNTIAAKGIQTDSNRIYFLMANKLPIFNKQFDQNATIRLAESISHYARKHGYQLLEEIAQGQVRTALISSGDFKRVEDYYRAYPVYLSRLEHEKPSIYYRMLSYIEMAKGKKDSAVAYFDKAGEFLDGENEYYVANYHFRKGELMEKLGQRSESISSYSKALKMLNNSHDLTLQNTLIDKLIPYYKEINDPRSIVGLLEKKDSLNMKLIQINKEQNIRQLELSNILSVYELKHQKAAEELNRKQVIQLQIVALFILLVFMSLLVMANLKLPGWWLRSMGYISIIILFEFIILMVDRRLHDMLHGSVIKLLVIKVILISWILPLHHWAEKKIVAFLLQKDRFRGLKDFLSRLFQSFGKKEVEE